MFISKINLFKATWSSKCVDILLITPNLHCSLNYISFFLFLILSFRILVECLTVLFSDHEENMQRCQGTMVNRIFETRSVWCIVWESSYSCDQDTWHTSTDTSWLGYSREWSPVRKPGRNAIFLVVTEKQLHRRIVRLQQEITFSGLLYKYTRNTAYGKGKDWFIGFLAKNADWNLKK
jgi:hypothetical protein